MTTAYDDYVSPAFLTDDDEDADVLTDDDPAMEEDEEETEGKTKDDMDDGEND
jgi:hypothetical protein